MVFTPVVHAAFAGLANAAAQTLVSGGVKLFHRALQNTLKRLHSHSHFVLFTFGLTKCAKQGYLRI